MTPVTGFINHVLEQQPWALQELARHAGRTLALSAAPFALSLSGLRRGEVLGARWSDVNLEGPQPAIVVRRSRVQLGHDGGGISEGEPKSARSKRSPSSGPVAISA